MRLLALKSLLQTERMDVLEWQHTPGADQVALLRRVEGGLAEQMESWRVTRQVKNENKPVFPSALCTPLRATGRSRPHSNSP